MCNNAGVIVTNIFKLLPWNCSISKKIMFLMHIAKQRKTSPIYWVALCLVKIWLAKVFNIIGAILRFFLITFSRIIVPKVHCFSAITSLPKAEPTLSKANPRFAIDSRMNSLSLDKNSSMSSNDASRSWQIYPKFKISLKIFSGCTDTVIISRYQYEETFLCCSL